MTQLILRVFLVLGCLLWGGGCGQKGPLFMEGQDPQLQKAPKKKKNTGAPVAGEAPSEAEEKPKMPTLEPAPPN